ncbi:MAG: hypothetical protein HUU32_20180 [Calditrichaceae bacterium]|nr:hypothetical protein [Calditrichia bacterium]NUQ43717.1 hypothetical protein [Calditrichaceae bacterium]
MAFIKNPDHPDLPICKFLRTKASYVPDLRNEHYMKRHHPYDQYYCLKTLHAVGPDDSSVCPQDCTPGRVCFQPLLASGAPLADKSAKESGDG